MPDLPTALLDSIADDPADRDRWLALASWLWDNGEDDEAATVRVLWPTLRDNLSCASLEATLADVADNAAVLTAVAQKIERQADETPPGW